MLAGTVEHGDSMGNRGVIAAGDIPWMTAGSGIIHQEMPHGDDVGRMYGFNSGQISLLLKMTPPRYQVIVAADLPIVADADGIEGRIVCGRFGNATGPVEGAAADPTYLDVWMPGTMCSRTSSLEVGSLAKGKQVLYRSKRTTSVWCFKLNDKGS